MSGYSYILRSTVRRDQLPKAAPKKQPRADVLTVEAPDPPRVVEGIAAASEVVAPRGSLTKVELTTEPKPRRRRKKASNG